MPLRIVACRRPPQARRGFTLIELLVVVVIIGILASVALPAFVSAQDRARNASVQANVKTIQIALAEYSAEYNGLHPEVTYVAAKKGGGGGNGNGNGNGGGNGNGKWGRGAGAPLDGLEDYLPGGIMPRSPWCADSQTVFYQPDNDLTAVEAIASNDELMTPVGRKLGGGAVANPPTAVKHYGAIAYDLELDSQVYVVYGTGKKNKDAILAGSCSNNGN